MLTHESLSHDWTLHLFLINYKLIMKMRKKVIKCRHIQDRQLERGHPGICSKLKSGNFPSLHHS